MPNTPISESRFQMWRCLVALVHTDHVIMEEERDFFLRRFDKINFTDEQKDVLRTELETATDVGPLFDSISDTQDRGTLIYFSRLLFWCDGEFAAQEEEILNHLHSNVLNKLDLEKIMEEVDEATQEAMAEYDREMESNVEASSFWSALEFALKSGLWPASKIIDMFD